MKIIYDKALKNLSKSLNSPLYLVGGYVRNFLIDKSYNTDVDLAGRVDVDALQEKLNIFGGKVVATYKRTGTIVFLLNGIKYEYTRMRKDDYSAGGKHQPDNVQFTDHLMEDALRRDFKCNAVYYDLNNDQIIDLLGGVQDIKNKVLDTVKPPNQVFCHDGLRLMRLARFRGDLGFIPTKRVIDSATGFSNNILDVSVERIAQELSRILVCDSAYPFSPKDGHYQAVKTLAQTKVLHKILPELTLGEGMAQPKKYHDYDVLEHSLKCLLYADKSVRLACLLHDVGKPVLMQNNGNFHGHEKVGANIVKSILKRLKFDNKTIEKTYRLTLLHMYDLDGKAGERKVIKLISKNLDIFKELLAVKQADFSACKDDLSTCPTIIRWQEIFDRAKREGVPFSLKELSVNATDIMELGISGKDIGETLKYLLDHCQSNPKDNKKERLSFLASKKISQKAVKKG